MLQHLLIGMNAHISLDLGIAAARTAPGEALPVLTQGIDQDFFEDGPRMERLDVVFANRYLDALVDAPFYMVDMAKADALDFMGEIRQAYSSANPHV